MNQENKSIRIRLLFYIILTSSIITFLFILLLLWTDLQDNLRVADNQVDQMESTVIPALTNSLWKFDESQIRISMESLLSLPKVIHVELSWQETQTGIHKIELGEKGDKVYTDNAIRHHDLVINANNTEDYYLGKLVLTTSDEIAYNNLYKSAFYIVLLQSLKTLLISAIILFIIRQILTRHILDISRQSSTIKLSNIDGVFSLNRKPNVVDDELDEVVNALNQMRLRIKEGVDQKQMTETALALEIENSREKEKLAFAAAKSDQEKSLFLASISHEIRTPMNTIMGFTHLLSNANLKDNERRQLNYIDKSARSLLLLINDILDMSKLDEGKADVESIAFYFADVIEMSIATFSGQAKEKHLLFDVSMEAAVPQRVWGDQNRLQQILNNLVSNSLKFTRQGKVTVNISVVDVASLRQEKVASKENQQLDSVYIQFSVNDTGVGIEPDYIPRIFDVFSQADPSTTRQYGGTGLGMPIVYKLVKLLGGDITVDSNFSGGTDTENDVAVKPEASVNTGARINTGTRISTGTTVKFTLPFCICTDSDVAQMQVAEPTVKAYKLQDCRILVADDVAMNQALMVSMLESMGAKVSVADDGKSAVNKVSHEQYDLLLIDIQMPEMNGFEATRQIRQQAGAVGNLPIIALTANVMDGVREQCIAAGMNDFLAKPFDPDILYKKIQDCLALSMTSSQRFAAAVAKQTEQMPRTSASLDAAPDATHDLSLPGIDVARGLKRWPNNQSEYFSHLLEFLDEIRTSSAEIDECLEGNQLQELKTLAHKISGSASFLALEGLATAAATIETTIFESSQVTSLMLEQYSQAVLEVLDNRQAINKMANLANAMVS
ncbi:MAG: response regulator [Pseudomonadales bacterium]|nr:response regulator [Pseudomonadales bacterium]